MFETKDEYTCWKLEGFLLGFVLAQEPGVEELDFAVDVQEKYVSRQERQIENEEVFGGFLEDLSRECAQNSTSP